MEIDNIINEIQKFSVCILKIILYKKKKKGVSKYKYNTKYVRDILLLDKTDALKADSLLLVIV
jgi:hypothetical protein